jgi:DUF971 family protein
MSADASWPTELRFSRRTSQLTIAFDDGFRGSIPYELLRVESPSAETQGHGPTRPPPPAGKRGVRVLGAEPVGRYAVKLRFDDGHSSGLYTWAYIRELAEQREARMAGYLAALAANGLSRD